MAQYYALGKKAGNTTTKINHYGHLQESISDCSNFSSGAKKGNQTHRLAVLVPRLESLESFIVLVKRRHKPRCNTDV